MISADVIVMSTPVYFIQCVSNENPDDRNLFPLHEINKKEFYFIVKAALTIKLHGNEPLKDLRGYILFE